MPDQEARIDALARAFIEAATSLGEAMSDQLDADAPGSSARVGAVISRGARVLIGLELSATAPAIQMITIDGDQRVDLIMSIGGKVASRH